MPSFKSADVQPFGVNPASVASHAGYARKMNFDFPLISDPGRDIARAYGAVRPLGLGIQRTVYAIRRDGTIALAVRGAPSPSDVIASLSGRA